MRRALALCCLPIFALLLSACSTNSTTGNFKGAEHNVAQTIGNLQTEVTGGEEKKICGEVLAASVVKALGGTKGCEAAIKTQLSEIDSTEASVESVDVSGKTATATVKNTIAGKKNQLTKVTLLEEGGKWKISGLQ
jgi:copper chaperone CopZ